MEPAQDRSNLAVKLIANKWRLTIIYALSEGLLRYGELQRAVGKVSHSALNQALRSLERDGIVERRMHKSVPPKVEYLLTPLGQSLIGPLGLLSQWAGEHEAEIAAAQSSFDERERCWADSPLINTG